MTIDEFSPYSARPGKYDMLNCTDLISSERYSAAREADILKSMDRANQETAGPLVNFLAYRDELSAVRAGQAEARRAAAEKHCTPVLEPLH